MSNKKRIKAVFFDIDDTLYSTTKFAELARRNAIKNMIKAGLNISEEIAYAELQEVISEFSSNHPEHFDKLLCRLTDTSCGKTFKPILIAAAVAGYHDVKRSKLEPFSNVKKLLYSLKEKTKLILGIITAGLTIKQAEKLWRLKIWKYFDQDAIFISDMMGVSKPNPKLFMKSCDQAGVQPSQAIYIGDNPANDIEPANQIGMTTFLIRTSGKYSDLIPSSKPDFVVTSFGEIWDILMTNFDIPLKEN